MRINKQLRKRNASVKAGFKNTPCGDKFPECTYKMKHCVSRKKPRRHILGNTFFELRVFYTELTAWQARDNRTPKWVVVNQAYSKRGSLGKGISI